MDAVGADEHVGLGAGAVGEAGLHAIAPIVDVDQAVREVEPRGGESRGEGAQQVGAMHLVVREAERRFERLGKRRSKQGAAIVPATLMPRHRLDPGSGQLVGQAQPVQHP